MASELKPVLPATLWQHYNGNKYEVLLLSNMESERQEKYPTTVVYRNVSNGNIYSRKLSDWHRSMTFIENTCPAPAATDTGLETVGYMAQTRMGWIPSCASSGGEPVVTRSQAEKLLAAKEAERAEQWRLRREMEADRDTQRP